MSIPEDENKSEVARLRRQIEQEYEAAWRGLHGYACVAQHEIISHHFRQIDGHLRTLGAIIGEDEATDVLIETMDEVAARTPIDHEDPSMNDPMPREPRTLMEIRQQRNIRLADLAGASGYDLEDLQYVERGGRIYRDDAEKLLRALSRLTGERYTLENVAGIALEPEEDGPGDMIARAE